MTMIQPDEEEIARSDQVPFIECEIAPFVYLSGVEVEANHAIAVAELVGWQECTIGGGGRYDRERRIAVRIALTLPVVVAFHRKLGAALSSRLRIASN
jgi:hypothetical protein